MRTFSGIIVLTILFCAGSAGLSAQQAAPTADWSAWQFFMGKWEGEGTGSPGEGTGGFSFAPDLGKRILVRKNFAEYPATKDRPAFRHDDLMIVYQETGKPTRAEYFDNEGHVIHYTAAVDTGAGRVVLTSLPDPRAPRFRFTYRRLSPDSLAFRFDIAPPGQPDSFAVYVQGTARRKR